MYFNSILTKMAVMKHILMNERWNLQNNRKSGRTKKKIIMLRNI